MVLTAAVLNFKHAFGVVPTPKHPPKNPQSNQWQLKPLVLGQVH